MVLRKNIKLADVEIAYDAPASSITVTRCGPMWMVENVGNSGAVTLKTPGLQVQLEPGQSLHVASTDGELLC